MNSTPVDLPASGTGSTGRPLKAMWATIAALGVAVVALGGVLLHQQGGSTAQPPIVAVAPPAAAPLRAPDDFIKPEPPATSAVPPPPVNAPAPPVAAVQPPVRAPEMIAPQVAQAGAPPQPAQPLPRPAPVCKVCGRVESVRQVEHQVPTSGVGAVAGGVLGGVLGHQIGNGNGRTAATVIGAVGGGFAGNEVEKRVHTVKSYEVAVRMQDGSLRTVGTSTAPPIGKAVTLKGNVLRPANGQK